MEIEIGPVKRRVISVAAAVTLVGLYAGLLIAGAVDDRTRQPPASVPGETTETVVWIAVTDVQPAAQTLDVNVTMYPGAGLVDKTGRLVDDLTVTLHPAVQRISLNFPRGREVSTAQMKLITSGTFQEWPFDHYETRNLVVEVAHSGSPTGRLVDTRVVVTGSAPAWTVDYFEARFPTDGSTVWNLTLHRDLGTLIFTALLCLVLVSLPVFALFVAVSTIRSKLPCHPPMLIWIAMMLFAVVPLRNLFPGVPPLGGWIDRALVIWVVAGLMTAQALYLYAWWRHTRSADGSVL